MADVGLGQLVTATGRRRSKKAKDAVKDNLPVFKHMDDEGGVKRLPGGRSVLSEALTDQNDTVDWVGPNGKAPLRDNRVIDSPEFPWYYMLGAVVFTLSEQYQNSGADQYIPLIASKFKVLETTQRNKFHEGILSAGTGSGGLQMAGMASLITTTPTVGSPGGIDRSSADAAWFRNLKFDTGSDWSDGSPDSGNVLRFLDQGLDATTYDSMPQVQLGLLGLTHWQAMTAAYRSIEYIEAGGESGKRGHNKLWYRGVPHYLSGGINYSGFSQQSATRTYYLNVEEGGFNICFHQKAEFDMLEPVNSSDQAAVSRLMFTMATCILGAHAKKCWVGF